jgi:hypothetical protein
MKKARRVVTSPIPKRSADEDDLLAAIRDVHVRVLALFERRDLCDWLLSDPGPDNEGFLRTVEELRNSERLFYQLRAARAITVAEPPKEGNQMVQEVS